MAVLAATWIISAGMAPGASAAESCGDANGYHCYAVAEGSIGGGEDHGISGLVHVNCLYVPGGSEANAEMWNDNPSHTYWTEVGIKSGVDVNGSWWNRNWFWADNRPNGGGYHEHVTGQVPAVNQFYAMEVNWVGNNTWAVSGGNSYAS